MCILASRIFFYSSISIQFHISTQLTLPGDAQPRMWHIATALSFGPGWTQVTMFGGCPKFESEKSDDAQQKLAKTTVLDFGEQNTHNSIHSLEDSMFRLAVINENCSYQMELKNPIQKGNGKQREASVVYVFCC